MALVADKAFAMNDATRSVAYAWIGLAAYSFQILFDFSGYSDMAIGLGKMFGFHFLENFDYPYMSKSISEFWRRWHKSLGEWFRDYVYFPLGGSRVDTKFRLVLNLLVVWLLTGVWHGANWTFLLWGLFYFALITFEKLANIPKRFAGRAAQVGYRVFTLICVMLGWALFRAKDLPAAWGYMRSMFGASGNPLTSVDVIYSLREYWFFFAAAILCSTDIFRRLRSRLDDLQERVWYARVADVFSVALSLALFIWSVSFLILGAHNPFVYFNF
ncbi:hypothetical protein FACS18948_0600 [Clostridia bacterium]|nr:hypothetical protein FACS18948_0600 [Clostridia bacterium]